jgi:hypothetical protein
MRNKRRQRLLGHIRRNKLWHQISNPLTIELARKNGKTELIRAYYENLRDMYLRPIMEKSNVR